MQSRCSGDESAGESVRSHVPVLLSEVIQYMKPSPGKKYIDATGGPGGMSDALLDGSSPDGAVLTIDCDPRVIEEQSGVLGKWGTRSVRRRANFSEIAEVSKEEGFVSVDGILFDLGLSSSMVDTGVYGASFQTSSRLDMRMDPDTEMSAYDIVNTFNEKELADLLYSMDEARWARRIARAIVEGRRTEPVETTGQLADIVSRAIPRRFHPRRIHPATKTFLALRVAVNHEKETLTSALEACRGLLAKGGTLIVICYSSFEDRIVKSVIRETPGNWEILTKKAVTPSEEEVRENPRSRSARLRAYRRAA